MRLMDKILGELPPPVLIALTVALLWLFKFIFKDTWQSHKERMDKHDNLLQQNTLALTELKVELRNLKELFLSINSKQDKIEKDINALHKARRDPLTKG